MISVLVICMIILLIPGPVVCANDYIEVMGQRQISFVQIGEGQLMEINPAIRAYEARQKATKAVFLKFKNWLESLKFKGKTLAELMEEDSELKSIVTKNLFLNFSLEEKQFPDGRVKIKLVRTWNGTELARVLDRLYRDRAFKSKDEIFPTLTKDKEKKEDLPEEFMGYTGIIIDTRGYHVKPSMAPKILDSNYEEVYGTIAADPEFVIEVGIVGYAYTLEEAKADKRVGTNPLVIKAIGRSGYAKDYAIISLDKAEFIRKMALNSTILNECKVMFVIDE
ncbi:hypothetical protein BBF96_04840 [Anoxybacter fermentans]|uniref:Uncharacterized protein n=1 Tax=Anoxybacter fermentans TaxID=1323375 RepID=A0A3Q9HPY3_9FIRM|nr:hypothetical protein [Anoxybacter fermentans]AZR72778.1 hypothetical protein BBF96_04840 [Anoxybacter fermentans]